MEKSVLIQVKRILPVAQMSLNATANIAVIDVYLNMLDHFLWSKIWSDRTLAFEH